MWGDQSVDYGEKKHDLNAIPSRHSLDWKCMELDILSEYRRRGGKRSDIALIVVHPMDKLMNAAVAALDLDDWNPEWPVPFYCRRGVWFIIEARRELLVGN